MKIKSHRHYLIFILMLNATIILYLCVFSIISAKTMRKQCENKWFQLGVFSEFHRE